MPTFQRTDPSFSRNYAKALKYALEGCNAVCVKITNSKELHDILEIYQRSQSLAIDTIEPSRPLVHPVGGSPGNYESTAGSFPEPEFILNIYQLFNEEFGLTGWFREHYEHFLLKEDPLRGSRAKSGQEPPVLEQLKEITAAMESPHVPVIVKTHPGQHPEKKPGEIVMVKGKDRCQMISAGLDYLKPGFRGPVVIKPDLVFPAAAPTTTSADIIHHLIQYLHSRQVVSISTADGSPLVVHTTTSEIADYCGYLDINGVNFIPLDVQDDYVACQCPAWQQLPSVQVHRLIADSNEIINVPVLKGHGICGMTGALKNNVGCTTRKTRYKLHQHHFQEDLPGFLRAVAEIAHAVNPQFTILDASTVMLRNHIKGTPGRADCMIMGWDMVAIDYQAAQLLAGIDTAFDPHTIDPLLDHAEMLGLGSRSTPLKIIRI